MAVECGLGLVAGWTVAVMGETQPLQQGLSIKILSGRQNVKDQG